MTLIWINGRRRRKLGSEITLPMHAMFLMEVKDCLHAALNRVAGVVNHETSYRDSRPREEREADENKRREQEFLACADGCLIHGHYSMTSREETEKAFDSILSTAGNFPKLSQVNLWLQRRRQVWRTVAL
ncbi:hypothetical protein FVEG_06259 [Fusarium verticillioides 7600]|uniref:Uncharacterized protein n=1 Tax=Gibberella moniliformis (strain M3125 / FGSC 7600) TaxID=334819 RepID=W7MCX8_GIBM7|nr:hypothetical protein FVEG_06259 [Fusarium verticillioides 7600]EWG45485.1 hypothetical protein FVEG_06259 [Fusarium verticillioides 7600]